MKASIVISKGVLKVHRYFKNVCQTMSAKHQYLQAYKWASPNFLNKVEVTKSILLFPDTCNPGIQAAMKMCQIGENADVSLKVIMKGTQYKKGHYVVLGKCENHLLLGEIQLIILNPCTQVYIVIQEFKSQL